MKYKVLRSLSACLLLGLCSLPALAATTAPPAVYPTEVRATEQNGVYYLEKIYCLSAADDPGAIPTADFEREGRTYSLQDILKKDLTETETRSHVETVTLNASSDKMDVILKDLEPSLEITTDDGYSGTLTPDYTSIEVEPAGYKTVSKTISTERVYPNLSNADLSLIPKTVTESDRALTLQDVKWQENTAVSANGSPGIRYNATATYTGTVSGQYATGYAVTIDYVGELTRTSCDSIIYTAIFAPCDEPPLEQTDQTANALPWPALILLAGLCLTGIGYGGWRLHRYIRDRKRGYVK